MKKVILAIMMVSLLAAGCANVELKREYPSSPKESYEPIPK